MENQDKNQYFKKLLSEVQPKDTLPERLHENIMQKVAVIAMQKTKQQKEIWTESPVFVIGLFVLSLIIWAVLNISSLEIVVNVVLEKLRMIMHQLVAFFFAPSALYEILPFCILIVGGGYFLVRKALDEVRSVQIQN